MREAVLLPEMVEAGVEALQECNSRRYGSVDTIVAVYLAMEAIREIAEMRIPQDVVH